MQKKSTANPSSGSSSSGCNESSASPDRAQTGEPIGRRRLLLGTGLSFGGLALGGLVAGCGSETGSGPAVVSQPKLNWRLASSFPRSLDTIYGAAEVLAARVEALSEGRFKIRCHPSGELVPPLQVLDATQQGTVQVGHTASYYYTGKNPALAFDTAMPFGLTARQQNAWLFRGGGLDAMRSVLSDFGIINFPAGNTGTQMGGWFRQPFSSLSELSALKMRIPGLGAEVMSRLGVSVQTIAGGEIYPALERGVIDATEWVGPYDDEKLGFHKVARHYYYPGWWEPGPTLSAFVNQKAWDSLPATYQEMFTVAAYEANTEMLAAYDALNPPALARLLGEGVELHRFPDDVLRAAHDHAFELMNEEASKDPAYKKTFDSWSAFRDASYNWFSTAEHGYENFAYGD